MDETTEIVGVPPSIAGTIAGKWVETLTPREGVLDAYAELGGDPRRLPQLAAQAWATLDDFVPLLDAALRVLGPKELRAVAEERFTQEMKGGRYAVIAPGMIEQARTDALGTMARVPMVWASAFNGCGELEVAAKGLTSIRFRVVHAPARFRASPGVRILLEGVGGALFALFGLQGDVRIEDRFGGLRLELWWGDESDLPVDESAVFDPAAIEQARGEPTADGKLLAGRYKILRALGSGGYGRIYEAIDVQTDRPVAIKRLRAAFEPGSVGWKRFVREARALADARHPNIVTIYDMVNVPPEPPFLILELLTGVDLLEYTRKQGGALSRRSVLSVARAVLSALGAAHALGIIHRDIKPNNIFLATAPDGSQRLKLLDFGLAERDDDLSLTGTGERVGTPAYMAPEQLLGEPLDARTDLYAVAATLYHLLTGRPVFSPKDYKSIVALSNAVLEDPPTPPSEYRKSLTKEADAAILRALAKSPEKRFTSSAEMLVALEEGFRDVLEK